MRRIIASDPPGITSDVDPSAARDAEVFAYIQSGIMAAMTVYVVSKGYESWRDQWSYAAVALTAPILGRWIGKRRSATAALLLIALNLGWLLLTVGSVRWRSVATALIFILPYARAYRALHTSSRD